MPIMISPNNFVLTDNGVVKVLTSNDNNATGFLCIFDEDLKNYPYPSAVHNIGTYRVTERLITGRIMRKCVAFKFFNEKIGIIPFASEIYFS